MRIRKRLYFSLTAAAAAAVLAAAASTRRPGLLADEAAPQAGLPKPVEETNCVRCHLTAGRELTEAVHTFAHSVHDLEAGISCHDCHGGNLEDDAKAHFAEFGFIGTKLSAHLAKCQECHQEQHELLASGPHQWDHQKRLNIQRPLCVDCHGNHDVGNPPKEFSMSLVCSECHRGYAARFPEYARITDAHDALWAAILKWQDGDPDREARVPDDLAESLAEIRTQTAEIVHASKPIDGASASELVDKMNAFVRAVESQAAAGGGAEPKGN